MAWLRMVKCYWSWGDPAGEIKHYCPLLAAWRATYIIESGVSTLLKTIAGETKGLHVDPESHFNFRGLFFLIH